MDWSFWACSSGTELISRALRLFEFYGGIGVSSNLRPLSFGLNLGVFFFLFFVFLINL